MRDFTDKEMLKYKKEIEKFRTPRFSYFIMKSWYSFLQASILPVFGILFCGGVLKNTSPHLYFLDWILAGCAAYFFLVGILIGISYIFERLKIRREAKKFELSLKEWNYIVKTYGIERK